MKCTAPRPSAKTKPLHGHASPQLEQRADEFRMVLPVPYHAGKIPADALNRRPE